VKQNLCRRIEGGGPAGSHNDNQGDAWFGKTADWGGVKTENEEGEEDGFGGWYGACNSGGLCTKGIAPD